MVDKKILVGDFEIASCFQLDKLPERRCVINTINAYSWVMTNSLRRLYKRVMSYCRMEWESCGLLVC